MQKILLFKICIIHSIKLIFTCDWWNCRYLYTLVKKNIILFLFSSGWYQKLLHKHYSIYCFYFMVTGFYFWLICQWAFGYAMNILQCPKAIWVYLIQLKFIIVVYSGDIQETVWFISVITSYSSSSIYIGRLFRVTLKITRVLLKRNRLFSLCIN